MSNFNHIKSNISRWNSVKADPQLIKNYFFNAQGFHFDTNGTNLVPNLAINAYPAIDENNELIYYLINADKDNFETYEANRLDFEKFIVKANKVTNKTIAPIETCGISETTVSKWIGNWNNHKDTWVDQAMPFDMYRVLEIPEAQGTGVSDLYAYFVLKHAVAPRINYLADLVIADPNNNCYSDTVRPVPPFGQGGNWFVLFATGG